MRTWILIAVTMLASACKPHPMGDSKSNWLRECGVTKDCAGEGSCICGVCTKTCTEASVCAALPGGAAACVSPSERDLPGSCGAGSVASQEKICLLACKTESECGERQACVHSVCVSQSLLPSDAGVKDGGVSVIGFDAGPSPPTKTPPPNTNPPPPDTTPPPLVDDEFDAGSSVCDCHKSACNCETGLVCHLDGLCAEPATEDSLGAVVLSNDVSNTTPLFAADDTFVYGLYRGATKSSFARWPLHGGNGQHQKMAGARGFYFNRHFPNVSGANVAYDIATTQLPVIADADRIYFVAGGDSGELSNSLWSMPKDDSAAPTPHGLAGSVIAQDQDSLYFSNDGDSRVLRLSKNGLDDTPEEIYASADDAPLTILLIAVNTSTVFVTELPPHATDRTKYSVKTIDKATKDVKELSTSDRFTTDAWNSFATDAYLIMVGEQGGTNNQGIDRFDLATTAVKPLGGIPKYASFADGYLYASYSGSGDFWRFDVPAAHATRLLKNGKFNFESTLGVTGGVFAVMTYDDAHIDNRLAVSTLVYVKTP